jgi:hypothetical protein
MTTIFKDMAGVLEKKATIKAGMKSSRLQQEANTEKVRVLAQIENLVDKLLNPNSSRWAKKSSRRFSQLTCCCSRVWTSRLI